MLSLLSPAKTLDLQPAPPGIRRTRPRLIAHTEQLLPSAQAQSPEARAIVDGRIDDPEALLGFTQDGYAFDEGLSSDDTWVFVRDQPQ